MKNVDDLIESAADLAERGRSHGEIADELNVSRETARWLAERAGAAGPANGPRGPEDVHVDWSAVGRDSARLGHVAAAMADLLAPGGADLVVGVENAGVPLATAVARAFEADLATYAPRKHQWEEGDIEELSGSFSRNFADVRDRACCVVDDTITTGTTMREAVEAIRERGGEPAACVVLVDKRGVETLAGVPVRALLRVIRVGDEPGGA